MGKIPIVVFHDGQWNSNGTYEKYTFKGVLVDDVTSFEAFGLLILRELKLDVHRSSLKLSILLDYGQSIPPYEILEDKDVDWFLTLVKDNGTRHPLVVDVKDSYSEGTSSSVVSNSTLLVSSSTADDDDGDSVPFHVIKDIQVDGVFNVKDTFASKEVLCNCFKYLAVKNNFEFRTCRSCNQAVEFQCCKSDCLWNVKASRFKNTELWILRKYVSIHNCPLNSIQTSHRQASSILIGDSLKEEFRFSSFKSLTPKEIRVKARSKLGVSVSYSKAYRAKEHIMKVLKGDAAESYSLIPKFFKKLEEMNPGTYTSFETNDDGRFKYCFMSMSASIEGWEFCRPNISVDGTFLKGKFGGILLTASTMDGNNQIFPLAFSIVDSENDASWLWFFENMKKCFGHPENLVFMSDRHLSIPKGFLTVYPDVEYCICMQHLLMNIKLHFKGSVIDKIFKTCAKAYTVEDFEYNMKLLESIHPTIRQYLFNIGYEKWARAYSRKRRYRMMTSNSAESINSLLKEPRDYPVAMLLDSTRDTLQSWFFDRRKVGASMTSVLSTWAEKVLRKNHDASRTFKVDSISNAEHKVIDETNQFLVNLDTRSCTCRVWDLDEIPCSHALAAIRALDLNPYTFVSEFYYSNVLTTSYRGLVRPVGNHPCWSSIDVDVSALPPIMKRQVGRPRKQRIPSIGETRSYIRCSRCHRVGHNCRTCKFAPTLK